MTLVVHTMAEGWIWYSHSLLRIALSQGPVVCIAAIPRIFCRRSSCLRSSRLVGNACRSTSQPLGDLSTECPVAWRGPVPDTVVLVAWRCKLIKASASLNAHQESSYYYGRETTEYLNHVSVVLLSLSSSIS